MSKNIINIGPTIARKLKAIHIMSLEDLRKVGVVQAYKLMQAKEEKHLPYCYYLYSLEGALRGVHWDDIGEREKNALQKLVKE